LKISLTVYHNVFRLKITVYNLFALKVLKNRDNLSSIESSGRWVEVAHASVVCKEISTLEELSDKIDVSIVLHEPVIFHL
jgi:hypothetical protein